MPKAHPHHATLGGSPDDVEAAFYEGLQKGDIEQLMACWADEDDIVCIHPGGPRIVGAGAIRAAFDAMRARLIYRPRGGKPTDARSLCYPLVVNNLVCRAMNAAASAGWPQVDAQVIAGC